jgi:hypothetical protein
MPSATDPPDCWNCDEDPIGKLEQMFVQLVQRRRIALGQNPARRTVFLKPHGVAHGWLEMRSDLPDSLKVGVFAGNRLDAWVRFSSDTQPTNPDIKNLRDWAQGVRSSWGKTYG